MTLYIFETIMRNNLRKDGVDKMEEQRCNMAASASEDCRCDNLLGSITGRTEDPRYKSLHRRVELEIEDYRCNRVAMEMEDPRCKGISSTW